MLKTFRFLAILSVLVFCLPAGSFAVPVQVIQHTAAELASAGLKVASNGRFYKTLANGQTRFVTNASVNKMLRGVRSGKAVRAGAEVAIGIVAIQAGGSMIRQIHGTATNEKMVVSDLWKYVGAGATTGTGVAGVVSGVSSYIPAVKLSKPILYGVGAVTGSIAAFIGGLNRISAEQNCAENLTGGVPWACCNIMRGQTSLNMIPVPIGSAMSCDEFPYVRMCERGQSGHNRSNWNLEQCVARLCPGYAMPELGPWQISPFRGLETRNGHPGSACWTWECVAPMERYDRNSGKCRCREGMRLIETSDSAVCVCTEGRIPDPDTGRCVEIEFEDDGDLGCGVNARGEPLRNGATSFEGCPACQVKTCVADGPNAFRWGECQLRICDNAAYDPARCTCREDPRRMCHVAVCEDEGRREAGNEGDAARYADLITRIQNRLDELTGRLQTLKDDCD